MDGCRLGQWHFRTGCDTEGHIRGKGKQICFNVFLASSPDIVGAIAGIGQGDKQSNKFWTDVNFSVHWLGQSW